MGKKLLLHSLALLAVLAFFSSAQMVHAALSGTYTVNAGGTASATNYLNIGSAISDMVSGTRADGGPVNGPGVSAAVTIRIDQASGPYNEQISIPAITGASATNTIRITGGPARATVQFAATTTTDRHVFRLTGCKHVTLDSLTLINTGATYGYGVWITNDADSNQVLNSLITVNNTSTSANFAGVTISGASATTAGNWGDYNLIQGNTISGGYYGISNNGTSTTVFSNSNHIINNTVREFYYYGIRNYYQNGTVISGNTVYARATATTSAYGMYLYYNDRFTIEKNRIYNVGVYGIYMYAGNYLGGIPSTRARVVNNMIGGGFLSTTPYGIYVSTNTSNVDFWHNTVSMNTGNGRCIYILGGSGNDVRNNVFSYINSTTGYAFYCSNATYVTGIDYNDYWCPGSSNFVYIGAAYTPATFIGGGGYNLNSLNGDPNFVNPGTDLHIASGTILYDAGANLGVPTDFDGDVRPLLPSVGYDIGADEFMVSPNDAGVFSLTSPVQPFASGLQNVNFTVKNYGTSPLTSATVSWQVNGVAQTPYAWTGALPSGSTSASFTAGTYNFLTGNTYTIRAWTSSPNGGADPSPANDTLTVNVCVGMSGTYSVGGLGADFPTINAAVAALVCGGAAGPVTLNLTQGAGPFNEQVIIPAIPGASANNTIRINGGALRETVQFTGTTNNERAVIKLNGADHIILDSLTITNSDLTYGFGVHLTNDADSNTVKSCFVNVLATSTSSNFAGIVIAGATATTAGNNGDGNLIFDNTINGGYYGITAYGTSTTAFGQRNQVVGNNLANIYYYGIQSYYQNRPVVSRNSIRHRTGGSATGYGIYMYYSDLFDVSKNRISSGGGYGIYVYYGNYQGGTPVGRATITNNMLGGSWLGTNPYGIYLTTNATNIDVFHNSVSMTSGNGRCLYITSGSGNQIRNNSFSYTGSTTGYAAYVTLPTYVSAMNHNNYYAPGSSNFVYIGSAFTPATVIGGAGFNQNSRVGDPLYVNSTTDLHAVATQLFDGGDPTVGLTSDIDDQVRPNPYSTIPDIGADEYLPDTVDVSTAALLDPTNYLCPDSFQTVRCVIFNKGLNTLSNIALTCNMTGPNTATLNATAPGPLAAGQSDTITLGTVNTWSGGSFAFEVFHSVLNDQHRSDDTLRVTRMISIVPAPPVIAADTICEGDSTTLIAVGGGTKYWYDAQQGGNQLALGDTLQTGPLTATTTYFVEARGTVTASLTTTFAGGNGCGGGNMFDLTAISTVTIDSFDLNLNGTAVSQVDVYYRVGSYAGFETNAAAWTLLGSANVLSAGTGQPTRCTIGGLTVPSGQTYAIYIYNPNVAYTTLGATYTTPEISVTTGVGLCSLFGGLNNPRTWNGRIYYQAEGCASHRAAVSVQVDALPTVSIGDTSNCGPVVLDAGGTGLGYSYLWSTGDSTQMLSVTNTGSYAITVGLGQCSAMDSAMVTINAPLTIHLGNDTLLCNGASISLDAGSNPGGTFAWSTSDTTQAITVNAAGTYAVSATTAAGCQSTDTLVVTTSSMPSGTVATNTANCPTIAFTATNSGGVQDWVTWDFGDGQTATGLTASNTYTANGTYTVTLIMGNACGTDTVTSTITITCLVGSPNASTMAVSLFPNPTRDNAALQLNLVEAGDARIDVTDMAGAIVLQLQVNGNSGKNTYVLDLSKLSAGMYTVRVRTQSLDWKGKLVKQ